MRSLLIALALAGVIVSGLALQVHYSHGTEPCSINARWDCGIVNHSSYSMVAGVPVAAIGIVGYLLLAVLAFARRRAVLLLFACIGLGYALHLSSIEKNVLEVWCLYCVISQCIIALLTLFSVVWIIAGIVAKRKATRIAPAG